MRTLLIILAVITLLGTTLLSGVLTIRQGKEHASMVKVESIKANSPVGDMAIDMAKSISGIQGKLPPSSAWRMGQIAAILVALFGVFALVATFLKKPILGLVAPGLLVLGAVLMMLLVPSLDAGPDGPVNPKTAAIIAAAMAVTGGGCVFQIHRMNKS